MSPTPIRAIVARFSFPYSQGAMEEVFKTRPFEFAAIISHGKEPEYLARIPTEHQEWFPSNEVRGCEYPHVDWNSLTPLDPLLIEKMRPCEIVFMDMVSRLEWKRQISYIQRKDWYLKHLRFWSDYLERNRINLYISAWIPHEIPDIIIYHLCKLKGIPVLYSYTSTMRDVSFFAHSVEEPALRLPEKYQELLSKYKNAKSPADIPLRPNFEETYAALTLKEGLPPPLQGIVPPMHWERVRQTSPFTLLKKGFAYLTPSGIARAFGAFGRWRSIRARNAFYNAHISKADMSVPFVYLALHFQPEASTVPMAGGFAEQYLMAEILDATLPEGIVIYLKEHPRESSYLTRDVNYYKRLLSLPKVRLIGRDVDTFELRERCVAIATASGSVGFEGLFRAKPVFMFGFRFYQSAPGIYHIRTLEDMKRAVQSVFVKKELPDLLLSRIFLKAMEETCVHATLNPWDHKVTKISDEEHIRLNAEAILRELNELESEMAKRA